MSEHLKHLGERLGELHAPILGGDGEGARSGAREVVIVNLPDNFDINDVFRSEAEPAAPIASAPPTPAPPTPTPMLALTATPAAEVRDHPEPSSHDRVTAPALSIADLLDNHVRLEWHEAVAIAQHLCRRMVQDPAASVHHSLVEPWNVEITNSGGINVLPGGSSSDPLVKQVGRVLLALLQDSIAPAELRLVASQASFEVPVYASVEELSAALRHFERPGGLDAIRAAFNRGLEAKLSGVPAPARAAPAVAPQVVDKHWAPRGALPIAVPVVPRPRSRGVPLRAFSAAGLTVIAAALFALVVWFPPPAWQEPGRSTPESRPLPRAEQIRTPGQQPQVVQAPRVSSERRPPIRSAPGSILPTTAPRALPRVARPESVGAPPAPSARITPPSQRPIPAVSESLEAERRAGALLAAGRADEAAIIFDTLVMKNPLYQLERGRASPEAQLGLLNSKRVLLPAMARRHYQEARAAYDAGSFSAAIAAGERALALLNDLESELVPVDLKDDVPNLVALATSARTLEEERIYTIADLGVTPPRPLGRQLATPSLPRRSGPPTGRLEILVDRSGRVETVRLETPLNGYHDRMIVSAVKAWHYKPALRNGRPVRYTLVMSITLPDL